MWKVTTQPAEEPVTLAEAKAHCRVEVSDDDTLITSLIVAARRHVELHIGYALVDQQITAKFDSFPDVLPMSALRSVTSVSYLDNSGSTNVVATSVYRADTYSMPGRIYLKQDQTWPDDLANEKIPVTVVYQAGIAADASEVPQDIKNAILLIVGNLYENREAVSGGLTMQEVPFAVEALLRYHRLIGV